MNTFGLDIGSQYIKIAYSTRQGSKCQLVTAGIIPTPQPGMSSEADQDLIRLATEIKKLHRETKIPTKNVVVGMPESQVFSKIIELPKMSEDELAEAIPWEAEQIIPLPISEITLDWQIVGRSTPQNDIEKIQVFIVAAPLTLVEKYQKIIAMAELELKAIETETIATSRVLTTPDSDPVLLIDIGASASTLAITEKGQTLFTRSIPTAGDAMTRAISTSLAMESLQAEQYKIAYGLDGKQLEGKVKKAIMPIFEIILSEIKKALLFWSEKGSKPVKNIVLVGGSSHLPELSAILTQAFNLEVGIADPIKMLTVDQKIIAAFGEKSSSLTVAIGLSMKEV